MQLTPDQSVDTAKDLHLLWEKNQESNKQVVLCPGFLALHDVAKVLNKSNIALGAQDAFYQESGAYTGEVSPDNLKKIGCQYVIVGHSERRAMGETDDTVNKKVKAVLAEGMTPIICAGEKLDERQDGKTKEVLSRQVSQALAGVEDREFIVAYEPVWAISTSGSGQTITPADAAKEIQTIKESIPSGLNNFAIIYGGSVKPDTVADFTKDFQGALVGGASLEAKTFFELINNA